MKNKVKSRVFNIFGLLVVSLSLFCGVIFGVNQTNINNFETIKSAAATTTTATYGNAETLLSGYLSTSASFDSSYSITDTYPLLVENQTSSNYCWIYSSMKALESTLIQATGEYYNFSETATAVLGYTNGLMYYKNTLNSAGNFDIFAQISQNCGLVYESEFSNDKFDDIDENNISNYSYVSDLASFEVINTVEAIYFYGSTSYVSASETDKQNIIKQFILENGGLTVGIEAGTIYYTSGGYYKYTDQSSYQGSEGQTFYDSHAVCIVGWDDKKEGFIAINSWGVESGACSTFIIPYDYSYIYTADAQISGFVYTGDPVVALEKSNASSFSSEILDTNETIKNVFTYEEEISLIYNYLGSEDFEYIYVSVVKGTEDVTSSFVVSYDYENKNVTITKSNISYIDFVGGTYLVKFYTYSYTGGEVETEIIAVENFTVYTGTEISYFKLLRYDSSTVSATTYGYAGLSSSVSSQNSYSFYVSYYDSFYLNFYMTELNDYLVTGNSLFYTYSIYDTNDNGEVNSESISSTSLSIIKDSNENGLQMSRYTIYIGSFSSFAGQRLQFSFTLNSMYYGDSITRTYYINFFVSESVSISNSYAYSIEYDLDGGLNSDQNVDIYPNIENDSNIVINLYEPSKQGYVFMGWFLDSNFTTSVVKEIDASFSGDIVLYAWWAEEELDYFETEFSLLSIEDYNGESKDVKSQIIYGDTITFTFKFTELEALDNIEYKVTIEWFINNEAEERRQIVSNYTGERSTIEDSFSFSSMDLGVGSFKVYVVATFRYYNILENISDVLTASSTQVIYQKQITAVCGSDQIYSYDGSDHDLSGLISVLGVYAEDTSDFSFETNISSVKEVGLYTLHIESISNQNYYYEFDSENDVVSITVNPKEISIIWSDMAYVYNSYSKTISYEFAEGDIVSGDTIVLRYTIVDETESEVESCVNVGSYTITATGLSNDNYTLGGDYQTTLVVSAAEITIRFNSVVERLQTVSSYRSDITYSIVSGRIFGSDDLGLSISCEGKTATSSGVYPITATWTNKNYNVTFNEATYTINGTYYVYYTLPDGTTYTETVEDLQDPTGEIPSSVYQKGRFTYYKYSQSLTYTGSDMYITVTEVSYFWVIILAPCILAFFVIYWFITRKSRRNKVS